MQVVNVADTAAKFRRLWTAVFLIALPSFWIALLTGLIALLGRVPGTETALKGFTADEMPFLDAPGYWVAIGWLAMGTFAVGGCSKRGARTLFLFFAIPFGLFLFGFVGERVLPLVGEPLDRQLFVPNQFGWELGSFLLLLAVLAVGMISSWRAGRAVELLDGGAEPERALDRRRRSVASLTWQWMRRIASAGLAIVLWTVALAVLGIVELLLLLLAAKIAGVAAPHAGIVVDFSAELWTLYQNGEWLRFSFVTMLVLIKIGTYLLFVISVIWVARLAMRLSRASADAVLAQKGFAPIIMLRSFDDDATKVRGRSWRSMLLRTRFRLEEVIAQDISFLGPFIAIGQPKDRLAPLGAYRNYYADDEWKDAIKSWLERSRAIVAISGTTPSFGWEIDEVLSEALHGKLVVLFPPTTDAGLAARWNFLRQRFESRGLPQILPEAVPAGMLALITTSSGLLVVTGDRRQGTDFQLAMRICAGRVT